MTFTQVLVVFLFLSVARAHHEEYDILVQGSGTSIVWPLFTEW